MFNCMISFLFELILTIYFIMHIFFFAYILFIEIYFDLIFVFI